jgi:hypothetical protein
MDNRLTLGIVHIVEWLRPGDAKTGRELFDELEPIGIASKPEVPVKFWRVSTKQEFVDLFPQFEQIFRDTGRIPVLHIETHGDANGIGVSAADRIDWPELMELFISFNRLTRLNLVAVLAACEGFWGVQMLQPARNAAAFRGLLGPNREVKARELATGCLTFYRTALGQMNGDAAIQAMNDAVDKAKQTFWTISAETAFKVVFKHFLETECTPEAIERRLARIEANGIANRCAAGLPDMFAKDLERARKLAREKLCDHRGRFEEMRREFFYIDKYPENDQRFDIKFEDVEPAPAAN